MSIKFSELLVGLLPGFLGLWVFKRIVQEDIDKRGEFTQVAIALLLAMSAFFFLSLLHWSLRALTFLATWISPSALSLGHSKEGGLFSVTPAFWLSYAVLCLFALFSGGIWAFICEKGWSPTRLLPRYFAKKLGRSTQKGCESALRAIVDEMTERIKKEAPGDTKYREPLVKVYKLGENEDHPLIGFWKGYSESEKEINLSNLEVAQADKNLNDLLSLQPRQCWINHNSGVVVEFLEWDKEQWDGFYNHMLNSHAKAQQQKE